MSSIKTMTPLVLSLYFHCTCLRELDLITPFWNHTFIIYLPASFKNIFLSVVLYKVARGFVRELLNKDD